MTDLVNVAKDWLSLSVHRAGLEQAELWKLGVGERARVAQVFRYMCDVVTPDWDVDCEYNRELSDPKSAPPSDASPSGLGTPDLVVHRRNKQFSLNNLLVAEFKPTHSNQAANSRDMQKVRYWIDTFGYQVGAVVSFGPSKTRFDPRVTWVLAGGNSPSIPLHKP